jgi:hypothetical protein
MRGLLRWAVVVAGAGVLVLGAAVGVVNAAGAAAGTRLAAGREGSGGTWGKAIEVPGTAGLNTGRGAVIASVSCGSAGNCSAGGHYTDSSGHFQVFVVSQVNGTWGKAIEVPGIAALNRGGGAAIASVSCASAGNCSAGGYYYTGSSGYKAFVVSQVGGTWGKAIEVPGTAALNTGGEAVITSVSCASAGNCAAGGHYAGRSGNTRAFVVSQVHGTWHTAIQVPGTDALGHGHAVITSVSCGSAGNCSAGGDYTGRSRSLQAFVVSQVGGTWGKAIKVPGTAALNKDGGAAINSVSCASAGNCSAGGSYADSSHHGQVFVVSQVNGTWGEAIEVPGTAALNRGGAAEITSVSCASAGNCSAGGRYFRYSSGFQVFVVSQVGGTWGTAIEVPGTAALNTEGNAEIASVSCASAGNCSAGGYANGIPGLGTFASRAFVVSQAHGTWHKAIVVPGTTALNQGGPAAIASVSCASAGNCSAGGYYFTGSTAYTQAFVVSET